MWYQRSKYHLLNTDLVGNRIGFRSLTKLRVASLVLYIENFLLDTCRSLLYRESEVRRVLIFRTGSIGDSICALPSIYAIREKFPKAVIDILTNTGGENLVGLPCFLNPGVYNEIIDYEGMSKRRLLQILRRRKYNLVIQLPQVDSSFLSLLRDLFVFRFVAKSGLGWHKSQISFFKKTQAKNLVFQNEIKRLLFILKRNGIESNNDGMIIQSDMLDKAKATETLKSLGWNGSDPLIAIVVGAKRPSNRWPIEYFDHIIEGLGYYYRIILIGSSEDLTLTESLKSRSITINTCGQFTPLESAAALSLCKLTISNDTGPMHLSYAVGTPTIALFSSRDLPGKWYPPFENNNHVFRELGAFCEECSGGACMGNSCMRSIKPPEVIKQARKMLLES